MWEGPVPEGSQPQSQTRALEPSSHALREGQAAGRHEKESLYLQINFRIHCFFASTVSFRTHNLYTLTLLLSPHQLDKIVLGFGIIEQDSRRAPAEDSVEVTTLHSAT